MNDYISEIPEHLSTQAGYQNLYEIRLYTSGPGQSQGVTYYRADIQVNTAADTWSVVFPAGRDTTTTTRRRRTRPARPPAAQRSR